MYNMSNVLCSVGQFFLNIIHFAIILQNQAPIVHGHRASCVTIWVLDPDKFSHKFVNLKPDVCHDSWFVRKAFTT